LFNFDGRVLQFDFASAAKACTFSNANQRISVTKQTTVDGVDVAAPREFPIVLEKCLANFFNSCLGGAGSWTQVGSTADLSDGETADFTSLEADAFDRLYRVREVVPTGWTLSVSCSGGTESVTPIADGAMILLPLNLFNEAAFADCTFTNETTSGSITVLKQTDPGGGEGFDLAFVDLDDPSSPAPSAFTLDDGGSQVFSGLVPSGPGGYEISETSLPPTWSLADIDCGGGSLPIAGDAASVVLLAGQSLTCTVTNTSSATNGISLTKTASPSAAVVGETITYTYVVTNTGPGTVADLVVVDTPLGPVTNLTPTTLGPGESATGTLTYAVTPADAGTSIVNTALATGNITCTSFCATAIVQVTATASVSVQVAAVGGAQATRGDGTCTTLADGTEVCGLATTGSMVWKPVLGGVGAILAGLTLLLFVRRHRRAMLTA
jgi:uncharacterized repeat protein (TIGR01451 family)